MNPTQFPQVRPRLVAAIATLIALAMFVKLGLWQWDKGARLALELERQAQRGQLPPRVLDGLLADGASADGVRHVVRGRYDPKLQFFIDNRQDNGRPGVHVISPMKIEGSQTWVLVNRGWTGWTHGRQHLPQVATPEGLVQVTGLAVVPSSKKFFLMPDRQEASPRLWGRLDIERFASLTHQTVQPVVVLQDPTDAPDGLVRNWPPTEDRVSKHRSYAWQWFGMAFALMCFYGFASLRRRPGQTWSTS